MKTLFVKIAALGSAVGGPMFVFDRFRTNLGALPAFLACFVPIGLQMLALLALEDETTDKWARTAMCGGIAGSVVLFAENEYAAWQIYSGVRHPNHGMIIAGIVIGTIMSGYVAYRAVRFLRGR